MKKYLPTLFLILSISLFSLLSCEKSPTGPTIIPDEEVSKIPFERLSGKIGFRRIVSNAPDEYYFLIIDATEHSMTSKALFYPYTPANFQFSPTDQNQVVFSYYVYNYDLLNYQWQLYIMDLTTLELDAVSRSYYNDSYPCWSPDGKKIAFWSTRNFVSGIWMQEIGADSAQFVARVHVISRTRPAFSSDGEELYVSSLDSIGRAILMKIDLSTNVLDTLLYSEEDSANAAFKHLAMSPDGEKLALVKAQVSGIDEIWLYDLSDQSFIRLTTGSSDWHPAWSPDGSQILFSRGRNLFIMNADGTEIEQVTFGEKNYDEYPTWIK